MKFDPLNVYNIGAGGHINPAVTFGSFVARKVTLNRAVFYIVAQCLGATCGAGKVKALQQTYYSTRGGGANSVAKGYADGTALTAEIVGTFVLVYTVFSATDPKSKARDSHVRVRYIIHSFRFEYSNYYIFIVGHCV